MMVQSYSQNKHERKLKERQAYSQMEINWTVIVASLASVGCISVMCSLVVMTKKQTVKTYNKTEEL